ncbi:uncharacterized protein METZ01_LOCUS103077 [marine metagenome]|uniref:Uncharacterized protein n=1 Tax=marine metagenome TaxID=408172 RepID=A0A381WE64_9ZZZZ
MQKTHKMFVFLFPEAGNTNPVLNHITNH